MALLLTPLERLANKSKKTLDVFTRTINELTNINQEIDIEVVQQEARKKQIEENIASLSEIHKENAKVIIKINQILS